MTTRTQDRNGTAQANGAQTANGARGAHEYDGTSGAQHQDGARLAWTSPGAMPWGDLTTLRSVAEGLTDAIKARCSVENRVKRGGAAADAVQSTAMIRGARNLEESYREMLLAAYQAQVPAHVRDWIAEIPGLGSGELAARIIAAIGHPRVAVPYTWEDGATAPVPAGPPYWRAKHQELWQYCGCGDPRTRPAVLGRRPTREELLRAGKLSTVRPLLYTFTSYLVRMHSRSEAVAESAYYQLYVDALAAAAGHEGPCGTGSWPLPCAVTHRQHAYTCRNTKRPPASPNGCGIVLHPEWGEPGSPWRPGHLNAHAHRVVHKEFLHDLWKISE